MHRLKLSPMPIVKVPDEVLNAPYDPAIDDADIVSENYDEAEADKLQLTPSFRNLFFKP